MYILEPYKGPKTRCKCPSCGMNTTFSMYVNSETGEHIHPDVGRCNREDNCGYHFTPSMYFEKYGRTEASFPKSNFKPIKPIEKINPLTRSFIPGSFLKQSLNNYSENNFTRFLIGLFGVAEAQELIKRFMIGTSKACIWGTVFWYVNHHGNIAYGRVLKYNIIPSEESFTGFDCKRAKSGYVTDHCANIIRKQAEKSGQPLPDWLKTYPESGMIDCFFGEHQLPSVTGPIGVVESEKTAIIASGYFPQITWIATGGKGNLNLEKCKVLKGRKVILFPDVNAFNEWALIAKQMGFSISDLLEKNATDTQRKAGVDLADFLIRNDFKTYTQTREKSRDLPSIEKAPAYPPPTVRDIRPSTELTSTHHPSRQSVQPTVPNKPIKLDQETTELIYFFENLSIPKEAIRLNEHTTIIDPIKFIRSHMDTIKSNAHNPLYDIFKERLRQMKDLIAIFQFHAT